MVLEVKSRNGKIDFYKFIFSIVIILYHFGCAIEYDCNYTLFQKGYISVEFFFIISGFLFARSLSKYEYNKETIIKTDLSFIWKKYKSFFPYHIFMCVLTFIVCTIKHHWTINKLIFKIINSIPNIFLFQMGGMEKMDWAHHEWYLSAMLIVMFILVPIIIRFRKYYFYYVAPILTIFIMGFLNINYKNLNVVTEWNGITYSGLLRAFAEISLGCICYAVYESKFFERFNKIFLIIAELLIYSVVLIYTNSNYNTSLEFSLIFFIAVGVTISFTDKTSVKFLNNKFIFFLGKLSFPIYLNHIWIRQIIAKMDWQYGYWTHTIIYVAVVIIVSVLCILIMDGITNLLKKN